MNSPEPVTEVVYDKVWGLELIPRQCQELVGVGQTVENEPSCSPLTTETLDKIYCKRTFGIEMVLMSCYGRGFMLRTGRS